MPPAVQPLHLGEGAVHPLLTAREDAHMIADLFRVLHDVGGEQDRPPGPRPGEDRVADHLGVHGVES